MISSAACVRFVRSLFGWFCGLPWGVGLATVRACIRIGLGFTQSGVNSAGNGAAMRAAIIGAFFADRPHEREKFGLRVGRSHASRSAGGRGCSVCRGAGRGMRGKSAGNLPPDLPASCPALCKHRRAWCSHRPCARDLALRGASTDDAARACGTSGFVLESVAFATFGFIRYGSEPLLALTEVIGAGGDTDSIAAILGGWLARFTAQRRFHSR